MPISKKKIVSKIGQGESDKLFQRVMETLDNNSSINAQVSFWQNELMILHGTNYMSYRMMRFMRKHPQGVEPSVIADYLASSRQTITNMADELESKEFIIRQSHPTDRRRILLILAEKGQELTDLLVKEMDCIQRRVFKNFTPAEMEMYLDIRLRIIRYFENEIKNIYQSHQ
ncbi:MarR family transcriptional regulator [Oscillospiraceae bacterium MB08-C2-2]|nr:MarR family transcriptional regulator [Oscillospiraceae bacterium MB08-C2-2]